MTVRPNGIPWGNYQKQNKTKKSPKTIKSKGKTILSGRLHQSGRCSGTVSSLWTRRGSRAEQGGENCSVLCVAGVYKTLPIEWLSCVNIQNMGFHNILHKSTHPNLCLIYVIDPMLCLPIDSSWEATSSSPGDEISKEGEVLPASMLRFYWNYMEMEWNYWKLWTAQCWPKYILQACANKSI
jgi:hypothetical protein